MTPSHPGIYCICTLQVLTDLTLWRRLRHRKDWIVARLRELIEIFAIHCGVSPSWTITSTCSCGWIRHAYERGRTGESRDAG